MIYALGLSFLLACIGWLLFVLERQTRHRLEEEVRESRQLTDSYVEQISELREFNAALTTRIESQKTQAKEWQAGLEQRFWDLANASLLKNAKSLRDENREQLTQALGPFRDRITEFHQKIDKTYMTDRDRLASHIEMVAKEARSLTRILHGTNKHVGNMGESILLRLFEGSGLRRGIDFFPQKSYQQDGDGRLQPDMVVRLPDERFVVIDSKFSFKSYQDYIDATDEDKRTQALKAYVQSVQAQIKVLASKKYENLHGSKSPDFAFMFIPHDQAFFDALNAKPDLLNQAIRQKVHLVSPSSLFLALSLIQQLWVQQRQFDNAQKIADQGALLYDDLVAFIKDLQGIGQRLDQAQDSYGKALHRLTDSKRGNPIMRAEKLRQLGSTPKNHLPDDLVEQATDSHEIPEVAHLDQIRGNSS